MIENIVYLGNFFKLNKCFYYFFRGVWFERFGIIFFSWYSCRFIFAIKFVRGVWVVIKVSFRMYI